MLIHLPSLLSIICFLSTNLILISDDDSGSDSRLLGSKCRSAEYYLAYSLPKLPSLVFSSSGRITCVLICWCWSSFDGAFCMCGNYFTCCWNKSLCEMGRRCFSSKFAGTISPDSRKWSTGHSLSEVRNQKENAILRWLSSSYSFWPPAGATVLPTLRIGVLIPQIPWALPTTVL